MAITCNSTPLTHPPLTRSTKLDIIALTAALLFTNGQTTERTIAAVERLGRALGLSITLHPRWGELAIQVEGAPLSEIVRVMPLSIDMGKVLATMTIIDQVCDGAMPGEKAPAALAAVRCKAPISTARFTLFSAAGGGSLGVIFGALNATSLMLIALSAGAGALLRRALGKLNPHPFIQPFCAATAAGLVGAAAISLHVPDAQNLIALCPCMLLVPGPHILNGAIDLARLRITLGIARLAYASLIILMICAGLLLGLGGAMLSGGNAPAPTPLTADVIAAGLAVSAYGTFFSLPLRLLPVPIGVGMLAHALRWALISVAGAHVAAAAFGASLLVGIIVTRASDRLHLPFAALAFSTVVSMMPGLFLFRTASALIALVSMGDRAPAPLLASILVNGATAFLVIAAITFGLILPRMLADQFPAKRLAT